MTKHLMRVAALVCALACCGNLAFGQDPGVPYLRGINQNTYGPIQSTPSTVYGVEVAYFIASDCADDIYYTTDGSVPTQSSAGHIVGNNLGNNPVSFVVRGAMTGTFHIKAIAVKNGVASAVADITPDPCAFPDGTPFMFRHGNSEYPNSTNTWLGYKALLPYYLCAPRSSYKPTPKIYIGDPTAASSYMNDFLWYLETAETNFYYIYRINDYGNPEYINSSYELTTSKSSAAKFGITSMISAGLSRIGVKGWGSNIVIWGDPPIADLPLSNQYNHNRTTWIAEPAVPPIPKVEFNEHYPALYGQTPSVDPNNLTLVYDGTGTVYYNVNGGSEAAYTDGSNLLNLISEPAGKTINVYAKEGGQVIEGSENSLVVSFVAEPTIVGYNDDDELVLGCATTGATIYFTTDQTAPYTWNSIPANTGTNLIPSNAPFYAFAIKQGCFTSTLLSDVAPINMGLVLTPSFTNRTLTLSCGASGATIYYTTDDSQPSESWEVYDGTPLQIIPSNFAEGTVIRAAVKLGSEWSGVKSITVNYAPTPVITLVKATLTDCDATVTYTLTSAGSTIYYTTDGTTPSTSSSHIASGSTVQLTGSTSHLKAIAYSADDSAFHSEMVDLTPTPVLATSSSTSLSVYRIRWTLCESWGDPSLNHYLSSYEYSDNHAGHPEFNGFANMAQPSSNPGHEGEFYWKFEDAGDGYFYLVQQQTGRYAMLEYQGSPVWRDALKLVDRSVALGQSKAMFSLETSGGLCRIVAKNPNSSTMPNVYCQISGYYPSILNGCNVQALWVLSDARTVLPNVTFVPSYEDEGDYLYAQNKMTLQSIAGAEIYYTTDGSTPTTSSTHFTGAFNVNGVSVIKAIAVKDGISSLPASFNVIYADDPTTGDYSISNHLLKLVSTEGATIYYSLVNQAPSLSWQHVEANQSIEVPSDSWVYAFAAHPGYYTTDTVWLKSPHINQISSLSQITDPEGYYQLNANINASGNSTIANFRGQLDGNHHTISGLTSPMFGTLDGAIIKNLYLDNINVSSSLDTIGAFANIAVGDTRIYNCGILSTNGLVEESANASYSLVSGPHVVGGMVGSLRDHSRVINCYNYAVVQTTGTSDGDIAAGFVGYNQYASTVSDIRTMVMNTMMYGYVLINGSAKGYYTFGGETISNKATPQYSPTTSGINLYNYYKYTKGEDMEGRIPNGTQACYEPYMSRFQLFMGILNSNRHLCAFYITDNADNTYEIDKWHHNDTTIVGNLANTPYPVLGAWGYYPSAINQQLKDVTANPYQGKQLGTLTVTVKRGEYGTGNDTIIYLPITDMDTLRNDYNYYKVQLPYYNQLFGGNYKQYNGENRVVTAWKITSVTGGTQGTFITDLNDPNAYNFADRNCTAKDLYRVSGRAFAQGGYYHVPEGVTAITIQAYWGKAIFVSDPYFDVTYSQMDFQQTTQGSVRAVNFTNAGATLDTYEGGTVYHSLSDALDQLSDVDSVYQQAIVLVGNIHHFNEFGNNNGYHWVKKIDNLRPFSFMSVDADNDCEPDYCYLYAGADRQIINPVRFDFVWMVPLGMASKTLGEQNTPCSCIFRPKGWFEITETCPAHFSEFEYDSGMADSPTAPYYPIILNNGVFDQVISLYIYNALYTQAKRVQYMQIGGHSYVKGFYPGSHISGRHKTMRVPLSVTGAQFDRCFLTGMNPSAEALDGKPARIYTNGGRFDEFCASFMEGLGDNNHPADVYGRWCHSIIGDFSGGSYNASCPVTGSVNHTLDYCYVKGIFTGGPKFGDMASGKTINIEANQTIFCKDVFGAGYGGYSTEEVAIMDESPKIIEPSKIQYPLTNLDYYSTTPGTDRGYIPGHYYTQVTSVTPGKVTNVNAILTGYKWEYWPWPGGLGFVQRWYNCYSKLSFTTARDVNVTMNHCTLKANYYGGGKLGKVDGNITSELHDCTVAESVFGAGFSAAIPSVEILPATNTTAPTIPLYLPELGLFSLSNIPATDTLWAKHVDAPLVTGQLAVETDSIYTNLSLHNLGEVSGKVKLTIDGESFVGGSVYGGGAQSAAASDTILVNVGGTTRITQGVYGGGFAGMVGDITPAHPKTDCKVFAYVKDKAKVGTHIHGAGKNGDVYGQAHAYLQGEAECFGAYGGGFQGMVSGFSSAEVSGGIVHGNLVGGGENGWVNRAREPHDATHTHTTTATINAGVVEGNVYGAGENGATFGHSIANINGGSVMGDVYGGAMGTHDSVYMAGLKTCNVTGGTVYGNVYGGSQNADDGNYFFDGDYSFETNNVNRKPTKKDLITEMTTFVNVTGGTMKKNVYGGGYYGKTYGSIAIAAGANAINNMPQGIYNPHAPAHPAQAAYFDIAESVFAGSNWGVISAGQDFGENDVWGYSHMVIDGTGYDTGQPSSKTDPLPYMNIGNSLYGCGTSTDAGMVGRNIFIYNYGYFDPSTNGGNPTRNLYTIQRCDSLLINNSHINLIGKGNQTSAVTTEKYAILNVEESMRMVNGSTVALNAPIQAITMLESCKKTNDFYAADGYYEVGYPGQPNHTYFLTDCDNKFKFNKGYYLDVNYAMIWGEYWSYGNTGAIGSYGNTGTIPLDAQGVSYTGDAGVVLCKPSSYAHGEMTQDTIELKVPAGKSFTVSGIPIQGKSFMKLEYETNGTITVTSTVASLQNCEFNHSNGYFAYNLYNPSHVTTIDLTFTNTGSTDAYIDDITLNSQRGLDKLTYGTLKGFFHVMGVDGTISFAFARPKVTKLEENNTAIDPNWNKMNVDDGGFVSYDASENSFDHNGSPVASGGVQIPYTNHMPKTRDDCPYYRYWMFKNDLTGENDRDGVLIARAIGNDTTKIYTASCRIEMPPAISGAGGYYVIQLDQFNSGNDIRLVNGGIYDYNGDDPVWKDYVMGTTHNYYREGLSEIDAKEYINAMKHAPNNTFGLTLTAGDGIQSIDSIRPHDVIPTDAILFARNANQWQDQHIVLPAYPVTKPEFNFMLTYSNALTMNATLDPFVITVKEFDAEGHEVNKIKITLAVTTVTNIEQDVTINEFANMMGNGDTHDTFVGKVTLPAFAIFDPDYFSTFQVTDIKVNKGQVGSGAVDMLETSYFDGAVAGTSTQFGLTFGPALTFANINGWEESMSNFNVYDTDTVKSTDYPVFLGTTDGRKEFSLDFVLHYNGHQLASNAMIDTVQFTIRFNNFGDDYASWHYIKVFVVIHRRGTSNGFYLDGIKGSNANSGIFPDDAKRTLKGIFDNVDPEHPSNEYHPGDLIFVVNDANIWDDHQWNEDAYGYSEVRLLRYPGGHEQKFNDVIVPPNDSTLVTINAGAKLTAHNIVLDGLSWKSGPDSKPTVFIDPETSVNLPKTYSDVAVNSVKELKMTFHSTVGNVNVTSTSDLSITCLPTAVTGGFDYSVEILNIQSAATINLTVSSATGNVTVTDLTLFEVEKFNPKGYYITPYDGLVRVAEGGSAEFLNCRVQMNDSYTPAISSTKTYTRVQGDAAGIDIEAGGIMTLKDSQVIDNRMQTSPDALIKGAGVHLDGNLIVTGDVKVEDNEIWYKTSPSAADSIFKPRNVYLPEYENKMSIGTSSLAELYAEANIGVTKIDFTMADGTEKAFTPVASSGDVNLFQYAVDAFTNLNFHDDQNHYPLFYSDLPMYERFTDYFHKTWVTEVTSNPNAPNAYDPTNINTKEKLAWLISYVNGENGSDPHPNTEATLTADVDMKEYVFVPIGSAEHPFQGSFDGGFHIIDGINAYYPNLDAIGMFGHVQGTATDTAFVKNTFVRSGTAYCSQTDGAMGGIAGILEGKAVLFDCESADSLRAYNPSCIIGGLVGRTVVSSGNAPHIHSSYSVAKLYGYNMGGLVGELAAGTFLENSFASAGFTVRDEETSNFKIGGLVGINNGTTANCYVRLRNDNEVFQNTYGLFAGDNTLGSIQYCYSPRGIDNPVYVATGSQPTIYAHYTPTVTPYYYKHADNSLVDWQGTPGSINVTKWPAMLNTLNAWVNLKNGSSTIAYTPWMRTTADIINNDFPVHKNPDFNTLFVANDHEKLMDSVLLRYTNDFNHTVKKFQNEGTAIDLYDNISDVNVYNDGSEALLYINENVSLLTNYTTAQDSTLSAFAGITFDNSARTAHAWNGDLLGRDWHLFSSPFADAPLGVNYNGDVNQYNYWTNNDVPEYSFYGEDVNNGFFPSSTYETGADYYHDWDYYCFYEPEYHWINFKRNTPSHWHEDGDHAHIDDYVNETEMVKGKGYMMAIQEDTYMQAFGKLNDGTFNAPTPVTMDGAYLTGYNLLGNPYQSYLDFDQFVTSNSGLWNSSKDENPFKCAYLVYDADVDGFIGYRDGCSENGWIASRYINPMQGFFVYVDNPGTAHFNNDMRVLNGDSDSQFRDKVNYPLINMWMNNGNSGNDILVVELGHPEMGGSTKMKGIKMGNAIIYAHNGNDDFNIFFADKDAEYVPVWFETSVDDAYTLYWETQNADFSYLHLIDNITGMDVDCLSTDHYTFSASSHDYKSRFKLVFDYVGVDEEQSDTQLGDEPFAFFFQGNLIVNGTGHFQLIDLNGRVLMQTDLYNQQNTVALPYVSSGMYLVRLVDGKSAKVQKIVINH